jgi:hypothetical protein
MASGLCSGREVRPMVVVSGKDVNKARGLPPDSTCELRDNGNKGSDVILYLHGQALLTLIRDQVALAAGTGGPQVVAAVLGRQSPSATLATSLSSQSASSGLP